VQALHAPELLVVVETTPHYVEIALQIITVDLGAAEDEPVVHLVLPDAALPIRIIFYGFGSQFLTEKYSNTDINDFFTICSLGKDPDSK